MHCPVDQTTLVMSERQGVEIDYCPTCRGVWLDRGELDKILDRAAAQPAGGPPAAAPAGAPAYGTPPSVGDVLGGRRHDEPGYRAYEARGYDERRYDERDGRRDGRGDDDRARPGSYDPRHGDPRRRKKRGSWLEDLLDFD